MRYEELIVWQKSMDLVDRVYDLVASFPNDERFCLSSQLLRAVVSVPSNIAEGSGRATQSEFKRFLSISRGSLYEVSTQLKIAVRRGYCEPTDEVESLLESVAKMLTTMLR